MTKQQVSFYMKILINSKTKVSTLLNLERKFLIFIIKKSINSLSKIHILKCSVQEWNIDKTNTNEYYKYLHPKPFSKLI